MNFLHRRGNAVQGRETLLGLRHGITNTNYYVQVSAAHGEQDRCTLDVRELTRP